MIDEIRQVLDLESFVQERRNTMIDTDAHVASTARQQRRNNDNKDSEVHLLGKFIIYN